MIAVTGGAGAMGGRIVRLLRERGVPTRVLDLDLPGTRARVEASGAEFRPADVSDPGSLRGAFDGADAVLHLAALLLARGDHGRLEAVNAHGTANVVEAARRSGVGRFVHVSSISVIYVRQNPYSLSKREAERIVRDSGLDWTILRPTLAWGDPLAAEYGAFRRVALALPVLPLPGGGVARKRPVHVDDLADAFATCLASPATSERILTLSGPETATLAEMALRIRAASKRHGGVGLDKLDRNPRPAVSEARPPVFHGFVLPIPAAPCGLAARAVESVCRALGIAPPFDWQTYTGLVEDADPDNAEARGLFSWNPRPWSPEP